MKLFKNFAAVIFCLMLWLVPAYGYLSPVPIEDGPIYGHKSKEGTISFFVKDSSYNNWKSIFNGSQTSKEWEVQLHKVLSPDGKQYYALHAEVNGKDIGADPVTGVILTLDNKDYALTLLDGVAPVAQDKLYHAWYALPDEAIKQLANASELSISYKFTVKPNKIVRPFPSKLASFKRLPLLEKSHYIREGQVFEPTADIARELYYPQVFIPNTTPEEVIAALIYEANFMQYKGKDEFNYSFGYEVRYTPDPQVVQFESMGPYDRHYSFITAAARPYKDGVWVTMGFMQKSYYDGKSSYNPFNKSIRGYWRLENDIWSMRLLSVQRALSGGYYSCGLGWKDSKTGPYEISVVNSKSFPELANIKEKDLIIAVNGVPTTSMLPLDMRYLLETNTSPVEFTIKSTDGTESKVVITPQFNKLDNPKKDYKALITKVPKRFMKLDKNAPLGDEFIDSNIFDPLGAGLK